ncbi:MAG: GGDEF domain-containing protein [Vulcanibacillus sp.]
MDTHNGCTASKAIEKASTDSKIGLIYLDIVRFNEIEKIYGQTICNTILSVMDRIVSVISDYESKIIYSERKGDDFFLYVVLNSNDDYAHLNKVSTNVYLFIKEKLNEKVNELNDEIEFHLGCNFIPINSDQSIESTIYSTIKKVVKQAKEYKNFYSDQYKNELNNILYTKDLGTIYQPIVSLSSGKAFGYEALTRGPKDSYFYSPIQLFQFAEAVGSLYELEKITRELAFQRSSNFLEKNQKLFVNISSLVIYDPNFTPGYTMELLRKYNLSPNNIIFEITERNSISDFKAYKSVLEHYRKQGFQIAIDDAGAGYSSLQAISELKPDYIKVDQSLVTDIDKNKVKENLLKTFVDISRKMNSKIIAEGIETLEELERVTRLGVHFGQGYFMARPNFPPNKLSSDSIQCIEKNKKIANIDIFTNMQIEELTVPVKVFNVNTLVYNIAEYFYQEDDEKVVVIVNDKTLPIGLVMKEKFNQELITSYNKELYWNKPINYIMDNKPLVVENITPIDTVAQMSIARDHKQLYDDIIVTKNKSILGVVSSKSIIKFLANVKIDLVRQANPLTGLPGNQLIHNEINKRIKINEEFTLIYADINYFKWFNDKFGFRRGDQLIKHTAEIIQEVILVYGNDFDFIGHIGGDDFIIITNNKRADNISENIVKTFDNDIKSFYDNPVDTNITGISLAMVNCEDINNITAEKIFEITTRVKNEAKKLNGSSIFHYEI